VDGTTFKRRETVVCREVAGERFLVPIHGHLADLSELFVLNEVGSVVWDYLGKRRSLEEVATRVSSEFEVDKDRALSDAEPFVRGLVAAGLAEECRAVAV